MNETVNLGITDGKYGDLTVKDGVVSKGRSVVVQPFANQLLIDLSARQSKSVEGQTLLDAVRGAATALGLTPRYVASLKTFFDPKQRWAEFLKSGDTAGLELSDEERQAVKTYEALKTRFEDAFTLPTPPKPDYVLQPLPKGVTDPLRGLTISGTRVSNGSYYIGMKDAKALWEEAKEAWRMGKSRKDLRGRRFSNDRYRTPTLYKTSITIGCQRVKRYQLEALAKRQGWSFD